MKAKHEMNTSDEMLIARRKFFNQIADSVIFENLEALEVLAEK